MRIQIAKETRKPPVAKKGQWPGVLVFEHFPEGMMIFEYARIRILTLRLYECAGNLAPSAECRQGLLVLPLASSHCG